MSNKISKSERNYLRILFGLFGLGLIALAPRIPNIKANLGVNNGTFGTLASLGAIGSLIVLLLSGQLVHKIGVRKILVISSTGMYGFIAAVPHIHRPVVYLFVNILISSSFSAYHVAIHTQVLHRQAESGDMILPHLHGLWSVGVLATAILSLLITSHISLAWHIDILMLLIWISTQVAIIKMGNVLLAKEPADAKSDPISWASLKEVFRWDLLIATAMLFGLIIEFVGNDWSTLVTKQELGISPALSILTFLAMVSAMIIGRLSIQKLLKFRSEKYWIRLAGLSGGIGFIIFTQLAVRIAPHHKYLALICEILAFFLAGLGTSIMSPLFYLIANRRSDLPASLVVAKIAIATTILGFIVKVFIAWMAQVTSISTALIIPGLMLMAVSRFAYLGHSEKVEVR